MGPQLRFLIGIILVILSFVYNSAGTHASSEETFFVVTAYYSPLPDQLKYTTGSYSGDIRLNGQGHTTASGKAVFPGLLAGPANYPFGTKLYFEGYGIGSIEDRGGAIVKAGERGHSYDRIDIWMGYGDEGLQRAITWGTRTIRGKIVVPSAQPTISFGESSIGTLIKLSVNPESSSSKDVMVLQEIFKNAELYSGKVDGEYASIESELIEFQIKKGLISGKDDQSAGWYGPKTIAALREEYGNNTSTLVEEAIEKFEIYNHKQASQKYKIILEYGDLQVNPDSDKATIQELQELLTQLGEYDGSLDGVYTSIETVLISLQKKIGLIGNSDDWGAGYFGNKTKSALWIYYEEENEIKIQEEVPPVIIEPTLGSKITYSLSIADQDRLDGVVKKIQSDYSKEFIKKLSTQIDTIIGSDKYKKYKNQLLYIKGIL